MRRSAPPAEPVDAQPPPRSCGAEPAGPALSGAEEEQATQVRSFDCPQDERRQNANGYSAVYDEL